MQGGTSEAWRQDVDKILGSSNNSHNRRSNDSIINNNNNNMGMSDNQAQLSLLLQQRQNQMDPQALLRLQQQGNPDNFLGFSGQNQGPGGFGGTGSENNDRMLLQLLNEQRQRQQQQQQQQQQSFDPLQQALLQRELERESLLQRINAMNGGGLLGLQSYGGLGTDALGLSQGSALDQTRLSSLLGGSQLPGQMNSPLLQGGLGGLAPGGGLGGAPGMVRGGPGGIPTMGFDDSITLEARSKQAFPLKLYRMLERAERNGQEDIISFIDDGKAFAIHKPRAFETDIMPSYFNSHRMSSFQRQLNIYVSHIRFARGMLALALWDQN